MYNPCFECLNRYGRKYSKECINICVFAQTVYEIKNEVREIAKLVGVSTEGLEDSHD